MKNINFLLLLTILFLVNVCTMSNKQKDLKNTVTNVKQTIEIKCDTVNISFDDDCPKQNSAIFADILLNNLGENKVAEFIETEGNSASILLTLNCDGSIRESIFRCSGKMTDVIVQQAIDTMKVREMRFEICTSTDYMTKAEVYKLMTERGEYGISMAFSNFWFIYYNPLKDRCSRFEYLKQQIEKYLPKN